MLETVLPSGTAPSGSCWWCLLMAVVGASAWGHVNACRPPCHTTVGTTLRWARAMSLGCAFSRNQVKAYHPSSLWQEKVKALLWQWCRWLQMHSYIDVFCYDPYPQPSPLVKECNSLNRKISKRTLKNVWYGCYSVALHIHSLQSGCSSI